MTRFVSATAPAMASPADFVDDLIDISLAAGIEIMAVYRQAEVAHQVKADQSPVSEADTRAEAVILAGLARAFPEIPVVAEEEVAAGRVPASAERFFLVDPLDGTKEFLNRNGEFTVNIALIEHGQPVAGVVFAPALDRIYAGSPAGAFQAVVTNCGLGERQPMQTRQPPTAVIAVGSRSHGGEATAQWLERYSVDRFVSRGSSLKFCLVAAGEADIYPRMGRTMEWDTAAGDAVLRAAGGTVTDLDGAPLLYNKRNQGHDVDFANGHFVAYGTADLIHRAAVSTAI
jgi:3'(2'),5'-bisphosphate nucleotidase